MLGTVVNAATVVAGSLVGLVIKKGMRESLADAVMKAMGVGTLFIGLGGVLSVMLVPDGSGALTTDGGLLLLVSLALGTLVGELLRIHDGIESLSGAVERRFHLGGFSKGFVTASLLFCAGAMTIVGSFNDGLYNDHSILYVKSVMDMISAVFLASTLGIGVMFSALFVLVYQGALTLCAGLIQPVMTQPVMDAVGMTGFAIVAVIGCNLMGVSDLKTTNMVPALVFAAVIRLLGWL